MRGRGQLHTVVKHEAFAVGEARAKYVVVQDSYALDALDDGRHAVSVEERSERFEELSRAAEALKRLKPQEVTALLLKAQGVGHSRTCTQQSEPTALPRPLGRRVGGVRSVTC